MNRKYRVFCADFETSVYEGQTDTEVWASALVEMYTEDVIIRNSIDSFFNDIFQMLKKQNIKVYFHNLRFDGSFTLDYFIRVKKFAQAYYQTDNTNIFTATWKKDSKMLDGEFKYIISELGQWYMITLRLHGHYLQIIDSYKLLPFSLANIGKAFQTKHQKLSIEYIGERHAGWDITPEEKQYIKNDVLVMKEALEFMYDTGWTKLTIASCCLNEFKNLIGQYDYKDLFPDLTQLKIPKEEYGSENADAYIRKSYRGGWCYLAKGKENKIYKNGITLDVNSLYPSVMLGEQSGGDQKHIYPYGEPCFWKGDYIPDDALKTGRYYFIRIRTGFQIKDGYLPTIQIKNNIMYKRNEYLETSKICINGEYMNSVKIGERVYTDKVVITLTMTDWELLKKHYHLYETEILDGCWFFARSGIFDPYINKYREIKMKEKGEKRTLAKLALNSIYGRLATSDKSSFKLAYLKEDETIGFYTIPEHNKKVVYIPCGSAITSYARNFTISAAQSNYYGKDKAGFIYADTDSIHCDLPIEKIKGVELSDTEFLKWKHESSWEYGLFLRQKTYIESDPDGFHVTACGMGKRCKELLEQQLDPKPDFEPKNEAEKEFLEKDFTLEDFKIGLEIPSNLKQKRMKGGVVLMEDYFCLR